MNPLEVLTDVKAIVDKYGEDTVLECIRFLDRFPKGYYTRNLNGTFETRISRELYNTLQAMYPSKVQMVIEFRKHYPHIGLKDQKECVEYLFWK